MTRFRLVWAGLVLAGLMANPSTAGAADSSPEPTVGLQFKPLIEFLQEVVSDPILEGALIGARVDNLITGRTVFSHHPDQLINPASVSKMFTTASSLCLLNPDFRFKTEIYAKRKPEDGVIKGPLYLKGYADPFLVNQRLTYLASELKSLGIEKIEGPLILDDSYFDNRGEGPGWSQDSSSRPYQAPMGALSLNFNSVAVLLFPGGAPGRDARLELVPDSPHFKLKNKVTTGNDGTRISIDVDGWGHKTRVMVRGRVSENHAGSRHHCRVVYPTWYTGHSFREALDQAGIKIRRSVRRGLVPSWAELIYTLRSPALGELVRKVNKRSQNFMAEQLYKTLGAEFLGVPGSWWKGQQVIGAFLEEEVGIPRGSYVLHNGSGLNDVNRVSVSHVVSLLKYMWGRFDVRPDFLASLAVAGADGTVWGRFTHPTVARSMRLKTGSLKNVRALAGYAHSRGNEVFAFAFLVSNYSCRGYQVNRLIDRFASALARADRNLQVEQEIEILPVTVPDISPIAPAEPTEGTEESEIPFGEVLSRPPAADPAN